MSISDRYLRILIRWLGDPRARVLRGGEPGRCGCGWDKPEPHMLLVKVPPNEGSLVPCPGSAEAMSLGIPVAT